jgi:hypothetical protein
MATLLRRLGCDPMGKSVPPHAGMKLGPRVGSTSAGIHVMHPISSMDFRAGAFFVSSRHTLPSGPTKASRHMRLPA